MAFAKTRDAESQLLSAFKERRVEKRYLALCFGDFPKDKDTLIAYLKKDESRAQVRIYSHPIPEAERIVTEYKVLGKRDNGVTLIEIVLHTGKTHQIRAHTAFIGCPVVGDMKYGDVEKNKRYNSTRQQLLAKELVFSLHGTLSYLNDKRFLSNYVL